MILYHRGCRKVYEMNNSEPIALVCRHDDKWTVTTTSFEPVVTSTALDRTTAVRQVKRDVAQLMNTTTLELSFVVTIEPPQGIREALANADAQQAEARRASATIMRHLLDSGWTVGDVAELVSKSNVSVKKFLQQEGMA